MILGIDLLTAFILDLSSLKHIIIGDDGTYEYHMTPMLDINAYDCEPLNIKDYIKTEVSFMDYCV